MNEFFIALGFVHEIARTASAGRNLNSDYSKLDSGGVSSLATCVAYIKQHEAIKAMIENYIALVEKDASDMIKLRQAAEKMDASLANTLRV